MKSTLVAASAITVFLCSHAFAEEKREADAHQHGHGALNVALEGETLSIEMETPGADILGFEHAAESAEDKAKIEQARVTLADPVALFGLPGSAGCEATEVEIEIGADETDHEDDHADDHDDHEKHTDENDHTEDKHDHDDHADEETNHSEVHAHYTLNCSAPTKISGLDLTGFFAAFPNAEEIDAAIITDSDQAGGEMTPDSPKLTF